MIQTNGTGDALECFVTFNPIRDVQDNITSPQPNQIQSTEDRFQSSRRENLKTLKHVRIENKTQ